MNRRPDIPAQLRREVLVESGHRCAIHTCKNPDVDVHHIIPWSKCKEHALNNLIALCPNCHRRVHNGSIDRKSLLMYKAQLILLSTESSSSSPKGDGDTIDQKWITRKVKIEENPGIKFSVEIEYPEFIGDNQDFRAINAILAGEAFTSLLGERSQASEFEAPEDEWWAKIGNAFASSYTITVFTEHFLSIRTSMYTYGAGAAHGNHATFGKNYTLKPLKKIELHDLFEEPSEVVIQISEFCIRTLEAEDQVTEPDEWIRRGAGPDWSNFDSFYLTESGVVIVFQPYVVGGYASGEREVVLTQKFLTPILRKESKLPELWRH